MYTSLIKKVCTPFALFCGKEKIPERGIELASDFKDLPTPPQGVL
jgi:hypothetical protein